MNILHICLASAFTEEMSYQENLLSSQNAKDGHVVMVIADCHKYIDGQIVHTNPEDKILKNGARLVRIEYVNIINTFVGEKIKKVNGLGDLIKEFNPDVILFHGVVGWELNTVAKYKKDYPETKLYLDCHEDNHNTAKNYLAKKILYEKYFGKIVKNTIPYVEKILYVSLECSYFLKEIYNVPEEKMEYFPLGGILTDGEERDVKRNKVRKALNITDENILIVHSGKLDELKKTSDLLKAFNCVKDEKLRLIIIGSIPKVMASNLKPLINQDKRITFLGWKSSDELMDFLCASDIYIQPGSQSATMQNAICCGSPIAVYPYESHKYLLKDNAFYVKSEEDIKILLERVCADREILESKQKSIYNLAKEVLDYKILAARLYKNS